MNKEDNNGKTALHSAAFSGHLNVTKHLISQGAEVNKEDNNGKTALHSAAFSGHLDVTKYLISQGAEVNKEDNNGKTALHSAASSGHLDVTKYLISQGAEGNKEIMPVEQHYTLVSIISLIHLSSLTDEIFRDIKMTLLSSNV